MIDFHNWFVDGFYNVSGFFGAVLENIFPYVVVLLFVLMIVLCLIMCTLWFWVWSIDSIRAFRKFKELYTSRLTKKEFETAFQIFWEDFRCDF